MNSWFCKHLGDAQMAFEPLGRIESLFQSSYRDAAHPKDAAVFVRHDSEGHLHCQVEVFFSPALALLAKDVDAAPCEKPAKNGLDLLIGSEDSWSFLFPDDVA